MEVLVRHIEKLKPIFERISNNIYLRAIRDGFISLMPVVLFSSLFLLVAYIPNIFEFYWSPDVEGNIMRAYNASMGILALLMSATTAKSLTDSLNTKLPKTNQINSVSTMVAAVIGFIFIGVDFIEGGFSTTYMGSKGLLAAFVVGFVIPNIYFFCVKNNVTVRMPEEVPGNIAQTFKDLIPVTASVVLLWLFDLGFRGIFGVNFAQKVIEVFQPLFSVADGYIGIIIVFAAVAFFWFVGIHGPSVVEPAVIALYIANVEGNFALYKAGGHATNTLSQGANAFVGTMGGTGATLVVTLMFAFLAKSKQMKAVGKVASVPVLFGVNEPILFGAPLVLNPVFFIPFITAPIVNGCLFKFFIDNFQMNGFIYNLPWVTPAPIGIYMGTHFAVQALLLIPLLLIADFLIYYPFFKLYEKQLLEKEQALGEAEGQKSAAADAVSVDEAEPQILAKINSGGISVLVLCANGATSSMLSSAINRGATEGKTGINVEAMAMAYGQHKDIIGDFDLVVLAPQMASMLGELEEDAHNHGTRTISLTGLEYVNLAQDPDKAVEFVLSSFTLLDSQKR